MGPEQTNGDETLSQTTGNETVIKQDGGAMHQCINELSNSLRNTESVEQTEFTVTTTISATEKQSLPERKKSVDSDIEPTKNSASHFVTVIEVKEMFRTEETTPPANVEEEKSSPIPQEDSEIDVPEKFVSAPLAAVLEAKKKIPPR